MEKIIDIEELKEKNKDNMWIFDASRALTTQEVQNINNQGLNIRTCFFSEIELNHEEYVEAVIDTVLKDAKELDDTEYSVSLDFVRLCIGKTLRVDEPDEGMEDRLPAWLRNKAKILKGKQVKQLKKDGSGVRELGLRIYPVTIMNGYKSLSKMLLTENDSKKLLKEPFGTAVDFSRYVAQLTLGIVESQTKN